MYLEVAAREIAIRILLCHRPQIEVVLVTNRRNQPSMVYSGRAELLVQWCEDNLHPHCPQGSYLQNCRSPDLVFRHSMQLTNKFRRFPQLL